MLDQYGSPSKNLEDWQLGEEHSFSGLFAYDNYFAGKRHVTLRGYGSNADGQDFTGSFLLKANCIGKRTLTVRHRGFNYFADATPRSARLCADMTRETHPTWLCSCSGVSGRCFSPRCA